MTSLLWFMPAVYVVGWWIGRRKGRREGLGMARIVLHAEMEELERVKRPKGDFGVIPRDGDLNQALGNFYTTVDKLQRGRGQS